MFGEVTEVHRHLVGGIARTLGFDELQQSSVFSACLVDNDTQSYLQ